MRRFFVAGYCLLEIGCTGAATEQEDPVSSSGVGTRQVLHSSRVGALSTGNVSRRYGCAA
jgi:hypothetical protein